MIKSVSLKEFSTTPTVSYMLSKDGMNIASHVTHHRNSEISPPAVIQRLPPVPSRDIKNSALISPTPVEEDEMYEIE